MAEEEEGFFHYEAKFREFEGGERRRVPHYGFPFFFMFLFLFFFGVYRGLVKLYSWSSNFRIVTFRSSTFTFFCNFLDSLIF